VDHDGLETELAEREAGPDAAVVELDALPDAVGPAAQDYDPLGAERLGLVLVVVRAVQVRRARRKLAGAGVDRLVRGVDAPAPAGLAHRLLARAAAHGELAVRGPHALHAAQVGRGRLR